MEHNPDRIALWPGYFDGKVSRRNGRRVPRDSAVLKPDLEGLFIAARAAGLKKVKREEKISHPNRPHGKEGRLWVSKRGDAEASLSRAASDDAIQRKRYCSWWAVNGGKCRKNCAKMRKRLQNAVL